MAIIGPRVGGAHVDVNLKFDPRSTQTIGRQIHRQLTRIGERNSRVYRRIGHDAVTAWRTALGTIVASAPHMGAAISAVAASATMLAGALYSSVQAAYALGPVIGALGVAAGTAALGLRGMSDAITAANPAELAKALQNLTPSARASALAIRGLRDEATKLRKAVQEQMFAGLSGEISKLANTLFPVLEVGLGKMADSLNGLFKSLLQYANSSAGLEQVGQVLDNSADIFDRLAQAAVPFLDGLLRLFNALSPAAKRMADRIAEAGRSFQSWTQAEGFGNRIDSMMKRAEKTAGLLWQTLKNLGGAIRNIFDAANPATNTFLQMLVDVTGRFKEWTASVEGQNAISEWAFKAVDVMRQFGKTISSVFRVTKELSSSDALISFLKTVESAFDYLGKLPLDKIVAGFVAIAEALQPISGPILAAIVSIASMNILFGNLLGQVAGFTSVFINGFKGVANVLDIGGKRTEAFRKSSAAAARAAGNFSKQNSLLLGKTSNLTLNIERLTGKAGGLAKILPKVFKFAGIAGLVVWITTLIAKSDELKSKVVEAFSALGGVFTSLKDAFSEIVAALTPVGNALEPVFNMMDKLMSLAIGVFLDTITYGFQSISNVIQGVGSIIAGFINILTGLFTLDFGRMWDGLKQVFSGIGPLLKGAFGVFVSFFAPARFLKLAGTAMKALSGAMGKGIKSLVSQVGKYLSKLGGAFSKILGPLKPVGAAFKKVFDTIVKAAQWLWKVLFGNSIFPDIMDGIAAFVNVVKGLFQAWVAAFQMVVGGLQAVGTFIIGVFQTLLTGVQVIFDTLLSVVTTVWNIIGDTVNAVVTGIWTAVEFYFNAIWTVISTVLTTVLEVITTVWNTVLDTITTVATAIWDTIKTIWNGIFNTIKTVFNNVKSAVSSAISGVKSTVTDGLNSVWNSIKALPGKVAGLAGDFLSAGKTIGGKVVSGMGQGLKNIVNSIGDFGRLVKDKINSALGLPKKIRGPGPIPDFTIPGFARGVRNFKGGLAMVGEEGAELVNLPPGSDVYSNRQTRNMLSGSKTGSAPTYGDIYVNLNMDDLSQLKDLDDFLRMMERARVTSRKTLRSGTVTV